MFKKILTFGVVGMGVLIVGGIGYLHITDTRPSSAGRPGIAKAVQKTAKIPVVKKDKTNVPVIPVMNKVLPDKEIELSGAKIAQEEAPAKLFTGAVIRPEFCWVTEKPEKIVKNVSCENGFINLTDYGLSEIKANIKVSKNEKGEDVFESLAI